MLTGLAIRIAIISLGLAIGAGISHAGKTKTTTGVVNSPALTQGKSKFKLNSNLRRQLYYGQHGKNYTPKWPKK